MEVVQELTKRLVEGSAVVTALFTDYRWAVALSAVLLVMLSRLPVLLAAGLALLSKDSERRQDAREVLEILVRGRPRDEQS